MPSLQETLTKRAKDALAEIDKRPGVFQLDPEEKGLLQGMAKGYQSFMTEAADTMLDDIERRHGLNGKLAGRMIHPGGKGRGAGAIKGVKVHHGEHGELFELASTARLSDVLKPDHQPDVSLDRWLAAVLLGDRCKDKAALDYAIEAKTVSGGTSGTLLPVGYQTEWTDTIRAQMVLNAAGMTTVTMNERTVTSSRILSDPVSGWRAEGGALTASDPTFELQDLVARSVYVRTKTTAELASDSPNYGAQLLDVMSASLAAEIDRAGLMGLGSSNEPRGIHNTSGINVYAYAGAVDTYDPLIIGVQKCLEANCPMEAVQGNAIMSPRSWAGWAALRSADGHYIARPKVLDNMVFRPTTAIPNNLGGGEDESIVIMGDFTQLVMGIRQEATVEALRLQSYGDNLLLEFIGTARIDFLVRRPASFTEITGVTIAP